MALSPAERSQRARHAALSVHARGRTNTGPARAAQLALLEQQVVAEALAQGENLSDDALASLHRKTEGKDGRNEPPGSEGIPR